MSVAGDISGSLLFTDQLSIGLIGCKLHRTVKDGQFAISIAMYTHLHFYIMASVGIAGNLQGQTREFYTVVIVDSPVVFLTKNIIQAADSRPRDKS